jgi:hypothetical protein
MIQGGSMGWVEMFHADTIETSNRTVPYRFRAWFLFPPCSIMPNTDPGPDTQTIHPRGCRI